MCNTSSNNPSFKERVQYYISKKEEIEAEYKSKMEEEGHFTNGIRKRFKILSRHVNAWTLYV